MIREYSFAIKEDTPAGKKIKENPNWKSEIKCPYCGYKYVEVAELTDLEHVYNWHCRSCGDGDKYWPESSLFWDWEEGYEND